MTGRDKPDEIEHREPTPQENALAFYRSMKKTQELVLKIELLQDELDREEKRVKSFSDQLRKLVTPRRPMVGFLVPSSERGPVPETVVIQRKGDVAHVEVLALDTVGNEEDDGTT